MTKKIRIVPNSERVICKFLDISANLRQKETLLVAGQLKAGENLLCAVVVDAGDLSKFQKGQVIYYSEYSASQLTDVANVIRSGGGYTEMNQDENKYIVIAEDDIMAYEEEVDKDFEVQGKRDIWKGASDIIKP